MSIMGCENCGETVDTDIHVDDCPHCGKDVFEKEKENKQEEK